MVKQVPPGAGLRVVDLGAGMAAALVAKSFAEAGATVFRIAHATGDPFDAVYPAHALWRAQSRKIEQGEVAGLLADADLCIVGGEDFPGSEQIVDAEALALRYPRLVVLKLSAYAGAGKPGARAADLLVQASTGLVWEQFDDRPICFSMPLPSYGAALLGMIGAWAALLERESSGQGQLVHTSMQQGGAMFWSPVWMSAEKPDAEFGKVSPKGVRHLIFECGDGGWIQFVMGVAGAVASLYKVLGIDIAVDPNDRGNPKPGAAPDMYFGDLKLIAPYVKARRRDELLQACWAVNLAAEPVLAPGQCWGEPQVVHNGVLVGDASGATGIGACVRTRVVADVQAGARDGATVADDSRPLAGARIIDLGSFVAGPFTSKILASLGADVIKVEPLTGSAGRGIVRHTIAADSGKRSIAVDMKAPQGIELVRALCMRADAVSHNFRVGVARRLGVDPASLRALRPGMVTLETSAYGNSGPKALNSGFDMVMQAMCGHEVRAGGEGNAPMWTRAPLIDYATGALGAVAVLMGLFAQRRTGHAVEAEVSLLDTGLFLMSELVRDPDGRFQGAPILNRRQTGLHPANSLYQGRDGWLALAVRGDDMGQQLAGLAGLAPGLPLVSWGDAERAMLEAFFAAREVEQALALLADAGVWAERCVEDGWAALQADGQARANGMVVDIADAHYERISGCLGPLMEFSRSHIAAGSLRPVPGLGNSTGEVMAELGYTQQQVADYLQKRVIA